MKSKYAQALESEDPTEILEGINNLPRDPMSEIIPRLIDLTAHPDEDVREESIRMLFTRWKLYAHERLLLECMHSDPSPLVRSASVIGFASLGTVETRRERTVILLEIFLSREQPLVVREAAYDGLVILWRKQSEGKWPFRLPAREFDLEKDVDWAWIETLGKL